MIWNRASVLWTIVGVRLSPEQKIGVPDPVARSKVRPQGVDARSYSGHGRFLILRSGRRETDATWTGRGKWRRRDKLPTILKYPAVC